VGTQTHYFQDAVLKEAMKDGSLGRLYWFTEAEYPKKMLAPGIKRHQPAMWPPGFVPVLPAGPDVEEQRAWAELLAGMFEAGNVGRGIAFKPALTDISLMEGVRWYVYGEEIEYEIDHICPKCGQVSRSKAGVKPKCECYEW